MARAQAEAVVLAFECRPRPTPRPVGIFHPAGPETGTPSLSHLRLGSKSRSQHLMSDGISL